MKTTLASSLLILGLGLASTADAGTATSAPSPAKTTATKATPSKTTTAKATPAKATTTPAKPAKVEAVKTAKINSIMGTITKLTETTIEFNTPDGKPRTLLLTKTTSFKKGTAVAKRGDLVVGMRFGADLTKDGKTAILVKLGGVPATK